MSILCKLGIHKWSDKKVFTRYGTKIQDYAGYCLRCHKRYKGNEKREEEKEEEEIEV